MVFTEIYLLSVLILAALLFFPVSRLIGLLGVRRLQRRLGRELSTQESSEQRRRAYWMALAVVLIFACLYNAYFLKRFYG